MLVPKKLQMAQTHHKTNVRRMYRASGIKCDNYQSETATIAFYVDTHVYKEG